MSPKGKQPIVSSVPPPYVRSSDYDWDAMAILAKLNKGKSVLAAKAVPNARIKSVRRYSRPPFVTDEGHVVVNMRNSHLNEDGVRVGDVYFSWADTEQKEN